MTSTAVIECVWASKSRNSKPETPSPMRQKPSSTQSFNLSAR